MLNALDLEFNKMTCNSIVQRFDIWCKFQFILKEIFKHKPICRGPRPLVITRFCSNLNVPASTIAGLLLGQTDSTLRTRLVVHSSFS